MLGGCGTGRTSLLLRLRAPTEGSISVDGIDYYVEPAQVFGVAGESGSGKTMSMLAQRLFGMKGSASGSFNGPDYLYGGLLRAPGSAGGLAQQTAIIKAIQETAMTRHDGSAIFHTCQSF